MEEGAHREGRKMGEYILVITTTPRGDGDRIVRALVEERLAACVNILPVRSHFTWENKLSSEDEEMLFIKTTSDMFNRVSEKILELHSYQLPEIIALEIADGHPPYLRWIGDSVL